MPVEGWGGSDVVNDFPGWSGLLKPSNSQVILNYDWCIFSHNSAADFFDVVFAWANPLNKYEEVELFKFRISNDSKV